MAVLKVISICLPEDIVAIIDHVKVRRRDPSRSNTIRLLLLEKLAEMSLLPDEDKKALGLRA
jgi:metal-responsive CopG/Arc/MetJ family transcriptional regulator